ncbi:MAG: cytochrome c oxidase subunit 3, partial [Thiomonas sp. 20-64-5]
MASTSQPHGYFLPGPSQYPVLTSMGLLAMALGAALWFNGVPHGEWLLLAGLVWLVYIVFSWFGKAIGESESGKHNQRVDVSYRWSMAWFIFSEVMFFASFFGALYYSREFSLPDLSALHSKILWPNFSGTWPSTGPGGLIAAVPEALGPWPIPTINTALLLSSGVTLTIAHHALRAAHRGKAIFWLSLTIALGVLFLFMQGYEYHHAYTVEGVKLTSGIYGSTFFMLTG